MLDYIKDSTTGLDVAIFENTSSREVSVIYVGTQGDTNQDMITDAQLATAATPAQYEAAKQELERLKKLYGDNLKFVGGNSLGGGLALYSSIGVDGIEVITFNPAPVPAGYKDITLNNAFNYISKNDPLFLAYSNSGMMNRLPGQHIMLPAGVYSWQTILENHISYKKYTKGEGSELLCNSTRLIPFSIFHKNTILGKGSYGDNELVNFP